MTRLPEIGDHVWRVGTAGKTVFDAAVVQVLADRVVSVCPRDELPELFAVDDGTIRLTRSSLARIPMIWLIAQVDGWRWMPRELRPEVKQGDTLLVPTRKCMGRVQQGVNYGNCAYCKGMPTTPALMTTDCEYVLPATMGPYYDLCRGEPRVARGLVIRAHDGTCQVTGIPRILGDVEPGILQVDAHFVAKALAGLDGWSWAPVGWPGEPAADAWTGATP